MGLSKYVEAEVLQSAHISSDNLMKNLPKASSEAKFHMSAYNY